MKTEQLKWTQKRWEYFGSKRLTVTPQLVIAFGSRSLLSESHSFEELQKLFPLSHIICCSTAGEILGTEVMEETIVATVIHFERTKIRVAQTSVTKGLSSYNAGRYLSEILQSKDLSHLLVLSDGLLVKGDELLNGMNQSNKQLAPITGGLAADGIHFEKTLVGINEPASEGRVAAIGFYGKNLRVGYGSNTGWIPFGPAHVVTRSNGGFLFELDGQKAIGLYRNHLGFSSSELPVSSLRFPICIQLPETDDITVRRVNVSEADQCLIIEGNLQEGSLVRFMKPRDNGILQSAVDTVRCSLHMLGPFKAELALLFSCVGRKLELNHRTQEEIKAVFNVVGENTTLAGFYSYGEISPLPNSYISALQNQTMTITTYSEA